MTHGVNFLPRVDRIIVLADGRITESDTFEDLINKNGDFADFIRTYLNEEGSEAETDPEGITLRLSI